MNEISYKTKIQPTGSVKTILKEKQLRLIIIKKIRINV